MATALRSFNRLQIGEESTKGTLVAATRVLPGDWSYDEEQDFYRSAHPRGLRANVGGAGVITRKGVVIEGEQELTPQDILWPLHCGVLGGVTPATSGDEEEWTFEPALTSGVPTIDSATIEFQRQDGSTVHYYGESGYCMCESFTISWAVNQVVRLRQRWFGRARQSSTITGSLTEYTGREPLVTNRMGMYLDTSWAGLGGSLLSGVNRSGSLEVMTGFTPDYTAEGRSDLDMSKHNVGLHVARLNFVHELDATGAARVANFRANDLVYIRLNFPGAANIDSNPPVVRIDGAYRFVANPSFSDDGEQVLVGCSLESVYDTTGTKTMSYLVRNELGALA